MKRLDLKRAGRLAAIGLAAACWWASGCSLLYELSAEQCESDPDCEAVGNGLVCRDSVCVEAEETGGSGGTGGASGGEAGAGDAPECETNDYCITKNFDTPWVCREGSCVDLVSTECPVVLGTGNNHEYLRTEAPILVGAFSNFEQDQRVSKSSYNYELAFDEFNDFTGGLPGAEASKRPLIAVVCDSDADGIEASIDHLVGQLGVGGIIAALDADRLEDAFVYANTDEAGLQAGVFFLHTWNATDRLKTLEDDNLLWHMLDGPSKLALPYVPLMTRAEDFQNQRRPEPTEPLDVLLIEADDSINSELGARLTQSVTFNDKSAGENLQDGHFRTAQIESELNNPEPDVTEAVYDLQYWTPDIVLVMATREVVSLIVDYEYDWWPASDAARAGEPPPFYLLSPRLFNEKELFRLTNDRVVGDVRDRSVGVNFVTVDRALYNAYYVELSGKFEAPALALENTENYYDAAYFMIYSFIAAGERETYTGADLEKGMRKLLRDYEIGEGGCQSPCFEAGKLALPDAIAYLRSGASSISLQGTLGPPNFDPAFGTRESDASVWCFEGTADYSGVEFFPDQLLYVKADGSLDGELACFAGF